MKLAFQDNIDKIENCPLDNIKGSIRLYRCVENPITENSFIPNAVLLKPKHQKNCKAWGLSLFETYDKAKEILNNLSGKKQLNYTDVAVGILDDADGIKNKDSKNSKHYTFFPYESLSIVSKFAIIEENGNN